MLTPQEINDRGFNKVMLNGYDMGEVDDFLETVSNDYNALYKENAILKGKLKVLVEKVEEYRSTEDAMRMALLTAQRMGEEITTEANRTKAEMIQNTEMEIKAQLSDTAKRVSEEETRLAIATKETTKFIELSQAIIRKHSEFLNKLETARSAVGPKGGPKQAAQDGAPAKQSRSVKTAPAKAAPPPAKPPPLAKPVPPAQADQPTQPVPAVPPTQYAQQPPPGAHPMPPVQQPKPITPASAQEVEIDDIASQIGSVVEKMADDEVATPAPPPNAAPTAAPAPPVDTPPPSLFEDDDGSVKLYSHDEENEGGKTEENSPRPKFDFDDLKFGANFDGDD